MKLSAVDFNLDWPATIKLKNLRGFIVSNLEKKGDVVRWSIIDIQKSIDSKNAKTLRIKAILAN